MSDDSGQDFDREFRAARLLTFLAFFFMSLIHVALSAVAFGVLALVAYLLLNLCGMK